MAAAWLVTWGLLLATGVPAGARGTLSVELPSDGTPQQGRDPLRALSWAHQQPVPSPAWDASGELSGAGGPDSEHWGGGSPVHWSPLPQPGAVTGAPRGTGMSLAGSAAPAVVEEPFIAWRGGEAEGQHGPWGRTRLPHGSASGTPDPKVPTDTGPGSPGPPWAMQGTSVSRQSATVPARTPGPRPTVSTIALTPEPTEGDQDGDIRGTHTGTNSGPGPSWGSAGAAGPPQHCPCPPARGHGASRGSPRQPWLLCSRHGADVGTQGAPPAPPRLCPALSHCCWGAGGARPGGCCLRWPRRAGLRHGPGRCPPTRGAPAGPRSAMPPPGTRRPARPTGLQGPQPTPGAALGTSPTPLPVSSTGPPRHSLCSSPLPRRAAARAGRGHPAAGPGRRGSREGCCWPPASCGPPCCCWTPTGRAAACRPAPCCCSARPPSRCCWRPSPCCCAACSAWHSSGCCPAPWGGCRHWGPWPPCRAGRRLPPTCCGHAWGWPPGWRCTGWGCAAGALLLLLGGLRGGWRALRAPRREGPGLRRGARALLAAGVLGLPCCGLQVYSALWLRGGLGPPGRCGWPCWAAQCWMRAGELGAGLALLAGAAEPLWGGRHGTATGHSCWAKALRYFCAGRKAQAPEYPNNCYDRAERAPSGDISKSLIRNPAEQLPLRALKDSNEARAGTALGAAGLSPKCPNAAAAVVVAARERGSSASLGDLAFRPPSPIDLRRSIDQALCRRHLLREGLFGRPRRGSGASLRATAEPPGLARCTSLTELPGPRGDSVASASSLESSSLKISWNPWRHGLSSPDSLPLEEAPSRAQLLAHQEPPALPQPPDSEREARRSFLALSKQVDARSLSSDTIEL
uniref:Proline-rich transmembrane protein 3/4 domain-containing protein n=1 Tax=Anas platyrhynchos TaxID=8839 RepID=A0A8B9TGY8_ANAPL